MPVVKKVKVWLYIITKVIDGKEEKCICLTPYPDYAKYLDIYDRGRWMSVERFQRYLDTITAEKIDAC